MHELKTQYGLLTGISRYSTHENGQLDSICLEKLNQIETTIGVLVPRYKDSTGRRKNTKCLSFYNNGRLKSIDLQNQTSVSTPLGLIDAELITFYENGSIKRIFPQNGALNGFWSEADEAAQSQTFSFSLFNTEFNLHINSIFFNPDKTVKCISLAPEETALVPTPFGEILSRIGFSLSADGKLLSLEPAKPVEIMSPIGILHAFDTNALGIHADKNSLVFNGDQLLELISSTDIIKITDKEGHNHYLAPGFTESMMNPEETEIVPMKVSFSADSVTFETAIKFTIAYLDIADIKINSMPLSYNECTDCATCQKCNAT